MRMRPGFRARGLAALVACAVGAAAAGPATAQLGPGRAGSLAQADNAATAATNPAGMSRLAHEQIVVETTLAYSDGEFDVDQDASTVDGGDPDNDPSLIGIPAFYWTRPVSERIHVGFSISAPLGIGSDYGNDWSGRYQAVSSTLFFLMFTPVFSYRINDWLSFGVGIGLTYTSFESEVAVRNAIGSDGQMKLEMDGWGVGGLFSVLAEPRPGTRFGLTYRLPTETNLSGEPRWRNIGPVREASLRAVGVYGRSVDMDTEVPQMLLTGAYHELDERWAVMADMGWVDFSEFGKVDVTVGTISTRVDADYRDIYLASLGLRYAPSARWAASVGSTYVSAAVSDSDRTLSLPWDDIWIVGIGAEHQLDETKRIYTSLSLVQVGEGRIDQQPTPISGRLVGKFERRRTILLNVSLVWGRR
jgi:long-chain fatty acid transport protein